MEDMTLEDIKEDQERRLQESQDYFDGFADRVEDFREKFVDKADGK